MSITSKYKNNLKSGGIWAFIGKFFTTFMTLVINAILARMLAAEDVGIYFLAFNFALFGAYIGTIGFEQTVVRFIADNLGKKQLKNVSFMIKMSFIATMIGSALVGTIFFFSSDWIALSVFQSVGFSSISMILIFWMAANSFQILLGETFRGFQDIRFASIFGGVLSTAIFTLTLGGIVYFQWITLTLHSTIFIWVLSLAISNGIGLLTLARKIQLLMKEAETDQKRTLPVKRIFSTTFPLMVVSVSIYILSQCDLWIIGGVGDDKDVAIYGAASKLAMLMSMPSLILNSVVSPIIAEKYAQGKIKGLERTLRTVATLGIIPALGLFLLFITLGKFILSIVFGSTIYGSGEFILILLALKQLINAWVGSTGTVLAMAGRQKQLMNITLWTGVASIILSILLGSIYGGVGVALGFLIPGIISPLMMKRTASKLVHVRADVDIWGTIQFLKDRFKARRVREEM
ncbi:MAG: oligosaccharide flippase family protein [Bacillus sp. (in: firmicutes)]